MPIRNRKGGSKYKKGARGAPAEEKLILRKDSDGELYAKVTKACGNGRFMVRLVHYRDQDPVLADVDVMGILPGRMRRRKWKHFVTVNDFVLIAQREFQSDNSKVDILHKYDPCSVRKLTKMGAVPDEDNVDIALEDDAGASYIIDNAGKSGSGDSGGGMKIAGAMGGESAPPPAHNGPVAEDCWEEEFDFDEI